MYVHKFRKHPTFQPVSRIFCGRIVQIIWSRKTFNCIIQMYIWQCFFENHNNPRCKYQLIQQNNSIVFENLISAILPPVLSSFIMLSKERSTDRNISPFIFYWPNYASMMLWMFLLTIFLIIELKTHTESFLGDSKGRCFLIFCI